MLSEKLKDSNASSDNDEIPIAFWKHYDNYRRGIISISMFSEKSGLSPKSLRRYLFQINLPSDK